MLSKNSWRFVCREIKILLKVFEIDEQVKFLNADVRPNEMNKDRIS